MGGVVMLSGLIDRVLGSTSERLPRDLALAIERASVMARSDDDSGDARILIVAAGLGSFYWEGITPAAQRIARHYPDLSPSCCRYAARLLAAIVADRNRQAFRGHRAQRRGWVYDF